MENKDEGLPEELQHKLHAFDESLTEVEDVLKPFLKIPVSDLHDKVSFAAIVIVLIRNIQAWAFTGIIIETLPMFTGIVIETLPMFTGIIIETLPMFTGIIIETLPMFTGIVIETLPMFTGIINETLPMLKKLAIPTLQPIYYVCFLLAWRSTSKGQTWFNGSICNKFFILEWVRPW